MSTQTTERETDTQAELPVAQPESQECRGCTCQTTSPSGYCRHCTADY